VVAPKSALGAWERDIELFNPLEQEILKSAITLINYDKVWRGDTKSPYNRKYGCIILDEAHSIKNRTSRRSKFLLQIACKADYRYILTGTPISNGQLENIWSLYCFLDPYMERGRVYSRIFDGSYQKFQDRYCILNMYHKPSSYVHVNELQEIINEHSYRVKKVDCLDLPDKLPDEIIRVDLAEKTLYKKLATESAILEYEILAENPLSRLVKLRQLASGHIKTDTELIEVENQKIPILQEIIEGYPDDKKLVIFAEFKYSISKISELLRKMKIKFITLDGDQKDKTIWRKFQTDKSIRVIVCQYQTAAAGIDLFASDTVIYYEMTLSSTILEQSRDRIHRTGQKSKCSYYFLLTKGTVEEQIYKALAGYHDFSEKLFTEYLTQYRRSYTK
jgi:SNF2 family DNA or RNA helicase